MPRVRTIIAAVVVFSTAVLAFAPGGVAAQPSGNPVASPPSTMRVDLVHTGGRGLEVFAIDRVVIEPLPWPGNRERAIDESNSGAYRFEVREPGGRLLFSRGYSTIFDEWVTTAEAAQRIAASTSRCASRCRHRPCASACSGATPHSSSRRPGRRPSIPAACSSIARRHRLQSLIALEEHGTPADKVDLLLIGDGYTAQECHDAFADHAKRMIAALFAHEPFRARRRDFNVWGLCPPSPQSGVARPSTGVHRRTPVGAAYDAFGSERYVLTFDNRALRDVAAWAPYEFVTILVNAETYGGGGIFGTFSTVAARSDWADYLFVHEFGHHFAGLADEYYTSPVAYEPAAKVVEPWEPNVTALLDPGALKWRAEVAAGTPVPTPWPKDEFEARQREFQALRKQIREQRRPESEMSALFRQEQAHATGLLGRAAHAGKVGAFQGANYDARAYYRPQIDCVMFTRDEVPFCRVCQAALTRVIDLYAGPARSE